MTKYRMNFLRQSEVRSMKMVIVYISNKIPCKIAPVTIGVLVAVLVTIAIEGKLVVIAAATTTVVVVVVVGEVAVVLVYLSKGYLPVKRSTPDQTF